MLTIDWETKIIFVPKSYTQLVTTSPFEIRQLDINQFRLDLRALESEEYGIVNERTHIHNTAVAVGGVTLARVVIITNGYSIEFEDGSYAVNLIGANSNIADVTNLNQVQVRSANSAGLTFSEQINNQSFNGKVWIDTVNGLSGQSFPRGTPTDPVNNWEDAYNIATSRKLHSFHLDGELIFNSSNPSPIESFDFDGPSPLKSIIQFDGRSTNMCTFSNLTLSGEFNGSSSFSNCIIGNGSGVNNISGIFDNCGINEQPITLDSGATSSIIFKDCLSTIAGDRKPIIDCNGTSANIQFRGYKGGLEIDNYSQSGNNMSIDMVAGSVKISTGCTQGSIVVRGVSSLVDESGVGCNVITDGLFDPQNLDVTVSGGTFSADTTAIASAVWDKLTADHTTASTFGRLLNDMLIKSDQIQHTTNLNTELLKNKPNNPNP